MRRDEALAAANECQQLRLLLIGDRHVAMAEEEDAVHVAQARPAARGRAIGFLRLIEDDVRVGANEGVPQPRLVSKAFDDRQRVRCEGMLCLAVACVGPGQKRLAHARLRAAAAASALLPGLAPVGCPAGCC